MAPIFTGHSNSKGPAREAIPEPTGPPQALQEILEWLSVPAPACITFCAPHTPGDWRPPEGAISWFCSASLVPGMVPTSWHGPMIQKSSGGGSHSHLRCMRTAHHLESFPRTEGKHSVNTWNRVQTGERNVLRGMEKHLPNARKAFEAVLCTEISV